MIPSHVAKYVSLLDTLQSVFFGCVLFADLRSIPVMTKLREEIDEVAAHRGLNRKQVATMIDLSPAYFSDLMNRRREFSPAIVKALTDGLKLTATRARRWQRLGAIEAGWELVA